jgi:hypothetical protein
MGEFDFKLGKLPATHKDGQELFGLSAVLKEALPAAPSIFGFGTWFHTNQWGMLANDSIGDCTVAGSEHETMLFTRLGSGVGATFSNKTAIADYSAITGYVPGDPSTDNGADMSNVMDYRRTTGMIDTTGKRHKIELAVRVPLKDWTTFVRAVYTFGAIAIGTLIPESAEQQFAAGQPWDYVGDQNILGGHYIPAVGSLDSSKEISVITWGQRQRMTESFFMNYVDELWLPLSTEVERSGFGLHHIDWSRVEALAKSL